MYSIDGGASLIGTSTTIITEGTHILSYYSIDKAGNREIATSTLIKIDKTSAEVILGASLQTPDLDIVGTDTLSSTTISKTNSSVKITDQAGNTTTLLFNKTYFGKLLTYTRLTSIQYGTSTPILLPSSFLYVWNLSTPPLPTSQSVAVDNQFGIEATYDKNKNRTTIIVLKKNQQVQTTLVSGFATIKLTTNKGAINYSW